jgi:hypothetical protein
MYTPGILFHELRQISESTFSSIFKDFFKRREFILYRSQLATRGVYAVETKH